MNLIQQYLPVRCCIRAVCSSDQSRAFIRQCNLHAQIKGMPAPTSGSLFRSPHSLLPPPPPATPNKPLLVAPRFCGPDALLLVTPWVRSPRRLGQIVSSTSLRPYDSAMSTLSILLIKESNYSISSPGRVMF